jgi:hypothetical protein
VMRTLVGVVRFWRLGKFVMCPEPLSLTVYTRSTCLMPAPS